MTKRLFARALAVWLLIILAESIHGTLRTLLLVPVVGDFPARQISVFTGAVIIFAIAWFTHRWMFAPSTGPRHVEAVSPGERSDEESAFPLNKDPTTRSAVIPSYAVKSCHSGAGRNPSFPAEAAHLIIGTLWVILTITFEITLGRVLGMPWPRILEDYNLMQGGLMPIGLLAMWATPWAVAKLRN